MGVMPQQVGRHQRLGDGVRDIVRCAGGGEDITREDFKRFPPEL